MIHHMILPKKSDWKPRQNAEILSMLGGHIEFPEPDFRLRYLLDNFDDYFSVTELGCWHGWHTVPLARKFHRVTAIDVRPTNVANTLLRLNLLDIKNVDVKLADVNEFKISCGILVHIGVLYHLSNPVEHLHRVLPRCMVICLDTHINKDGLEPSVEFYNDKPYYGGVYHEHGWDDPLSGVDNTSLWLNDTEIFRILQDNGFDVVFKNYHQAPPGPRLNLVATKSK